MNNSSEYSAKIQKFKKITEQVASLIEQFPKDQRTTLLFDKWSLKDIIAHLNNWMVHDIECLTALKNNKEPYWEPDVDEFNAKGIEIRKNWEWDKIYNEFTSLKEHLLNVYETFPNDLWEKPIWKKYQNQTPHRFLDDDISHWANEHLGDIKEKLAIVS